MTSGAVAHLTEVEVLIRIQDPEVTQGELERQVSSPSDEGLLDIYNLSKVSKLWEAEPDSFFAQYANGQWDPSAIPGIPPELSLILGAGRESTTSMGLNVQPVPPPELEQSIEKVYLSYLSDTKSPTTNSTQTDSSTSSSPVLHHFPQQPFSHVGGEASSAGPEQPFSNTTPLGEGGMPRSEDVSSPSEGSLMCSPMTLSMAATRRFRSAGYLEAPLPRNEAQRRNALQRFFPFTQVMDPNINRILTLAQMVFSVNNAAISLVDSDITHVQIPNGDPVFVPRGDSMCSHTILIKTIHEPLVILDTLKDWRFQNNPTVTGAWSMRFYAGQPLRTDDNFNIGTICLIDDKPRETFTEMERAQLQQLADMVLRELQSRQLQREAETRQTMHSLLEDFNYELSAESSPMDQISAKLVETVFSSFNLEGFLVLELPANTITNLGKPEAHHATESTSDVEDEFTILVSSAHASLHPPTNIDAKTLLSLLKSNPDGVCYNAGDFIPAAISSMSSDGMSAVAAILITRGNRRLPIILCVYTADPMHRFDLPETRLSFLRDLGIAYCAIEARQALSLADRAKVDFIANISHELRTPLHGVLASCELLRETYLSEAQESLLETAQACASSLTETINHILDFTKATSRTGEEAREEVDLAWLVESTMHGGWIGRGAKISSDDVAIGNIYAPGKPIGKDDAPNGSVEPLIEIQPLDNWTVMLDKAGLRRILLNLIGNSMKFTKAGYVKVILNRVAEEAGMRTIELVVEDTGMGMSSKFVREKLFHPFSQEYYLANGLGLGLAIVRSLLKSPGIDGTIDVQSKLKIGTRMTIRLKAPVVQTQALDWLRSPAVPASELPPMALCGGRSWHRGSVLLHNSLRQNLNAWYGDILDSKVEDARMLLVDGDGVDIDKLPTIGNNMPKILLMSSVPVSSQVFRVSRAYNDQGGVCLILIKPVGPHLLAQSIQQAVDAKPSVRHRAPSIEAKTSSQVITPNLNQVPDGQRVQEPSHRRRSPSTVSKFSDLRILIVEDNPVNRKVLATFLRKRECVFEEACDGVEGVQKFKDQDDGYFHVILMDIQMPLKDGWAATKEIRDLEAQRVSNYTSGDQPFRPVHIFALTGLNSAEDKEKAVESGFDGYLVKPVPFKTLDVTFKTVFEGLSR